MGLNDKIKNAAEDIAGKAKEAFGAATDNEKLQAEGQADQASAAVKNKIEDVKDVFKK
ncbi:CsbD family protein [Leucobacter sp. OH2974_COT-288]|nr:CsbD family protein [Leucobacter sp. OH2974_COT-288]